MALVLLVGAGLLLVLNAADGDDESTPDLPKTAWEKRAERIERRLGKDTTNERSLLVIARAWIGAGHERLDKLDTQDVIIPRIVTEDFRAGLRAWNRYLEQTAGKAGTDIAQLAAGTYFELIEIGSRDLGEVEANAAGAVRAARIAAKQQPGVFTHSNLAIYQYFNGEFAAGDRTAKVLAVDLSHEIHSDPNATLLRGYRANAERFVRREKRAARILRESGDEQLPFLVKGYGSRGGLNGGEE